MKEIRLWEVIRENGPSIIQIDGLKETETENLLEEILVRHPDLLFDGLKLVGRQTPTAGGPLDLLGVDSDGQLVLFELKRGNLNREAVAQIIDYASYLGEMEPDELAMHISKRSGSGGIEKIEDFLSWYQEQFAKPLSVRQKPRMVLVGLGADDTTRRMVNFLVTGDIDVSLITFHAFSDGGKLFLSRQVEVESAPPPGSYTYTKEENLKKLEENAKKVGLSDLYFEVADFLQEAMPLAYQWPNPWSFSYSFPEKTISGTPSQRVYVSPYLLDKPPTIRLVFQERAVQVAEDSFKQAVKLLKGKLTIQHNGNAETRFNSFDDWNSLQSEIKELCLAIMDGWEKKREKEAEFEKELPSEQIE